LDFDRDQRHFPQRCVSQVRGVRCKLVTSTTLNALQVRARSSHWKVHGRQNTPAVDLRQPREGDGLGGIGCEWPRNWPTWQVRWRRSTLFCRTSITRHLPTTCRTVTWQSPRSKVSCSASSTLSASHFMHIRLH